MRITVKTALICSLIWIIIKMSYHLIWPNTTELTPMIFSNMFLLITSISMGLYLHKKKEGFAAGNALSDIKSAMTAGVPYAVIVSIFMFLYYNNINPAFIEQIREPKMKVLEKELSSEKYIKKLKQMNPELETKTTEEIHKLGVDNLNAQTNPKSTSIMSLLGMIMMSTVYSILITVIYRKVLIKGIR
ncbi:MAG: DUF4199 domain-containing protein [Flavobacteriia bacterium]|jgi:hypothetical protein